MSVEKWWNLWQEKAGETPRKTYPDPVSSTTKPTWSDRRKLGTPAVGGERLTACTTRPHNTLNIAILHAIQESNTGTEFHMIMIFQPCSITILMTYNCTNGIHFQSPLPSQFTFSVTVWHCRTYRMLPRERQLHSHFSLDIYIGSQPTW